MPITSFLKFGGRLKAHIFVSALLQRAVSHGAFGVVVKKGDKDAGAVVVCVRQDEGHVCLYQAATNMDGERVWHESLPARAQAIDGQLKRLASRDPDLWIVEIDDREGRNFLTETVVKQLGV